MSAMKSHLKGSKMLQLYFSISMQAGQQSTRTCSQGRENSKIWEREMAVQECSLASRPGDPPGTYLWTQEDAGATNHITATP